MSDTPGVGHLAQLIRKCAEQAAVLADSYVAAQRIPTRQVRRVRILRERGAYSGYESSWEQVLDVGAIWWEIAPEVVASEPLTELVRAIFQKPVAVKLLGDLNGNILPSADWPWTLAERYVRPFLDEHVLGERIESVCERLLPQFEEYLTVDTFSVRFTAPLVNLTSAEDLRLYNDTSIRRLSDEELLQIHQLSPELDLHELGRCSFAIETVQQFDRFDTVSSGRVEELFDASVTALRLHKQGNVAWYLCTYRSVGNVFFRAGGSTWRYPPSEPGPAYILERKDLPSIKAILARLSTSQRSHQLDLAIRRFNQGIERDLYEDRLIDHWIALEALFAKEGETQELSFKFSIRIAHYVGTSAQARLELFGSMRTAYTIRSKVVHGVNVNRASEAAMQTEEALRRALRRVALGGGVPDLDDLDRKAASGRTGRTR